MYGVLENFNQDTIAHGVFELQFLTRAHVGICVRFSTLLYCKESVCLFNIATVPFLPYIAYNTWTIPLYEHEKKTLFTSFPNQQNQSMCWKQRCV